MSTPSAHTSQPQLICDSYLYWTKTKLIEKPQDLFYAPFAVLSHGVEADPLINYVNILTCQLWGGNEAQLIGMPSRLTALTPDQEERARLLKEVTENGYIKNYSGIRVSLNGKQFKISNAVVFNLLENGIYKGQAAIINKWESI